MYCCSKCVKTGDTCIIENMLVKKIGSLDFGDNSRDYYVAYPSDEKRKFVFSVNPYLLVIREDI